MPIQKDANGLKILVLALLVSACRDDATAAGAHDEPAAGAAAGPAQGAGGGGLPPGAAGSGLADEPPSPAGQSSIDPGAPNAAGSAALDAAPDAGARLPLPDSGLGAAVTGPTWHGQIAPLVEEKCSGCHAAGGIAPFALDSYESASALANAMLGAVESGVMPPWLTEEGEACQPRHNWQDDWRLSEAQISLLRDWAAADAPQGDPATAAALPAPPSILLQNAGLEVTVPGEITVDGSEDRFLCFSVDPGLTEDTWFVASQVVPGNSAIVHHMLTYADPGGLSAGLANEDGYYECFGDPGVSGIRLLGAWAPGGVPLRTPDDVAMLIPAGSRIILNVHYHPTSMGAEFDQGTKVAFELAAQPPTYLAELALIGNFQGRTVTGGDLLAGPNDPQQGPAFVIPAGIADHTETMTFTIPQAVGTGIRLWAMGTHMHYVGTDMMITVDRPNPGQQPMHECLIHTPHWDFEWQRGYVFDAPLDELPTVGAGDVLTMRCTYDNSLGNAFVREALEEQGLDEPRDVFLGEGSLDEMCLGVFGTVTAR